jgi:hypothetical protein
MSARKWDYILAARSLIGVYLADDCLFRQFAYQLLVTVRLTDLEQFAGGHHHDRQSPRLSASLENIFVSYFVPGCFILNFLLPCMA